MLNFIVRWHSLGNLILENDMKLYYAPGTCAVACWIAAEWAGVDYQVEKAALGTEEYKKINPLGSVPALELEDGQVRTQAVAIMNYIAIQAKEKDLLADQGDAEEAKFDEIMFFLASDFHPAFWPFFGPQKFTTSSDNAALEAVKEAAYARIDRVMNHLDSLIGSDDHVYNNKRTIADAYAYVMANWTKKIPKDYTNYPNVNRFMESMNQCEGVKKVMADSVK